MAERKICTDESLTTFVEEIKTYTDNADSTHNTSTDAHSNMGWITSEDEIADFVLIQEELEKISITVETLQLWSERMLARGFIDMDVYNKYKNK